MHFSSIETLKLELHHHHQTHIQTNKSNLVISRHDVDSVLTSWSGRFKSVREVKRHGTHSEFRHFFPKAPESWFLGFPGPCLVRLWLNCRLPRVSPVAHGRPVRRRVPFKWALMELIYQINKYVFDL